MGYYIRVLTKSTVTIPVADLRNRLEQDALEAKLVVTEGDENAWDRLDLLHNDPEAPSPGGLIAILERNLVEPGPVAEGEVEEFAEDIIVGCKPKSAVEWLKAYLANVKTIYCFQVIHGGADWRKGWHAIQAVQGEIWGTVGGIFQADGEGFSNEDGYHILWQFSDDAEGPWKMAVLDTKGNWVAFEMDLGNRQQRDAF